MSAFASRFTSLAGPSGVRTAALSGTTELLSRLVGIPDEASSCRVQGVGGGTFAYRLDGTEGEAATACLVATTLPLSNRPDIDQLVICSNSGATDIVVQFSSGTSGPGILQAP